ncbi:uncharacterized protein LOC124934152 [Impatiens glandulifera]|uniref:uncharacterized protein LOC124934152 n=1 Tax=Impatiens glandulifera TaxID=253017 RepID=UPI001FB187C2|nr:uncharacterized protein LOC124934152 [Impatiens glandulifera]XP_047330589.1 uncharacterized protein LOC124934152 [Impatiens glandulifera]
MYSNVSSRKGKIHTSVKRRPVKLTIRRDAVKTQESDKEDRRGSKKTSFRRNNDDSSNVVYSDGYIRRKENNKGFMPEGKERSQSYKSHKRDYGEEDGKFESRNLDRKRRRDFDGPEKGMERHSYGEERSEFRNGRVKGNSKPFEAGTRSNDKFERFSYKTSERRNGYDGSEKGKEERSEFRNGRVKEMRTMKEKSGGLYQHKNSKPFEAGTRSNDKFERFSYNTSERRNGYDGPEKGREKHSYGQERSEFRNGSVREMRTMKGKPFEAGTRSNYKFERFNLKTEKKNGYGKFEKSNGTDFRSNKQKDEFADKYTMRNMKVKKTSGIDSTEDFRPRKKKKLMKIDRFDISNKKIVDNIVSEGNTNKGKKDVEENTQISKNAQFRAIIPSPSILSFVEDNLLGRRRLNDLRKAGYNRELSAPLDNIPSSTSLERERIEDPIFRNKLDFFAAAKVSSSFPPPNLPEVAFAGRSNVGKSSLLNALTRQWGVVRTSDKPGLTQTINFFNLGTKLCLVDLPGYGFAYAKDEVKESWEELVKEYVSTRVGLKRVCLLIDTKWGMKPRDYELIGLMERYKTKYQIVLTKTDTVFPIDVARRATQIEETLKKNTSVVQPSVMVSAKSGAGIRSLRAALTKIARFAKM